MKEHQSISRRKLLIGAAALDAVAAGEIVLKRKEQKPIATNDLVNNTNNIDHEQIKRDAESYQLNPTFAAIPNPKTDKP